VLQGHGDAQPGQKPKRVPVRLEAFGCKVEVKSLPFPIKVDQRDDKAHGLANDRGHSRPQGAPAKTGDEDQVQDQVGKSGNGDKNERPAGIAHAAQYRGDRVVPKDKEHAAHADERIIPRLRVSFRGHVHGGQHPIRAKEAEDGDEKGDERNKAEERTDGLLHAVHIPPAYLLGDDDLTRGRKAHAQAHSHMHEISAASYGREAGTADVASHYDHVHHVIDDLQ